MNGWAWITGPLPGQRLADAAASLGIDVDGFARREMF
jgi:hypothetical protein